MESARLAVDEDLGAIVELAREARDELTPLRGGAIWRQSSSRTDPLEVLLAQQISGETPDNCVIVGTIDGTVVGYAVSTIEQLRDGSKLANVTDIFVAEQARGVGVGDAMFNLILADGQSKGVVGIDAIALPGDRQTKNFFESHGLKARALIVHRDLG